MTRKHYQLIAEILEVYRPSNGDASLSPYEFRQMVRTFADELGKDNDRFDRARFLEAVGYDATRDDTAYTRHNGS